MRISFPGAVPTCLSKSSFVLITAISRKRSLARLANLVGTALVGRSIASTASTVKLRKLRSAGETTGRRLHAASAECRLRLGREISRAKLWAGFSGQRFGGWNEKHGGALVL